MGFVNTVTYQRRFTLLATSEFLKAANDEYSEDILTRLREIIVKQCLCVDLKAGTTVYRARKVDNPDEEYLFKDITAPPEKSAFPNRMSPAGVSMFYASFDKDTAMNECVGDETKTIIVGTFKTKRDLRIIDLSRIPENSFWMKGWQENQFLHKFNSEITKCIDPNDKNHLQYVPTQVFTAYLRYMFKDAKGNHVDGLIYGSSKTKDKNLVLFCNQNVSSRYVDEDVIIEVFESKAVCMSKNEDNWLANFEALKSYIAEHGHLPNHYKPENRNLHSWARYQQKRIKAGTMPEDQKVLFDALMASRST